MFRVGLGTDIHPFKEGRKLILGGVEIPSLRGLDGHSDADVILHALSDGILGAAGLDDIGHYFPGDLKNKDRSSLEILREVMMKVWALGYRVENIDISVLLEEPKISEYRNQMKENIAEVLKVRPNAVGIKASTSEKMGFVGRKEGAWAQAIVLLRNIESEKI